jgi:hypothetical protein
LAYEHGPALGVGVKSDGRYAATVFGIQFSYRPNQANRGLTLLTTAIRLGNVTANGSASTIRLV